VRQLYSLAILAGINIDLPFWPASATIAETNATSQRPRPTQDGSAISLHVGSAISRAA